MLTGAYDEIPFALLDVGRGQYAAEVLIEHTYHLASVSFLNGTTYSAQVTQESSTSTEYNRWSAEAGMTISGKNNTIPFILCCIQTVWDMAEADPATFKGLDKASCTQTFTQYKEHYGGADGADAQAEATSLCAAMTNTLIYGIENKQISISIPNSGNPSFMTEEWKKVLTGVVLAGTPHIFLMNRTQAVTHYTIGELRQEFASFSARFHWTQAEQDMIPVFPDDYKVPQEVAKFIRCYVNTFDDKRPMKNFCWRSETSLGKSTGVKAIASILQMPFVSMNCTKSTETTDFLSSFVPDTSGQVCVPELDYQSICYDPVDAYHTLTGITDEDMTSEACFAAYIQAIKSAKLSGSGFKRVESAYIQGLMHGYVVEVAESSRIKDAGVLVGINNYDEPGAMIPLVDGSYAKRSPNALVVFTDNVGYDSCNDLDPSVLRRFSFIIDSEEISKEDVMERLRYNTGCTDKSLMEQLYDIWKQAQTYCRDNEIRRGTCSVTELEMLLRLEMMDKYAQTDHLRQNVQYAIVSKASSDPEEQADILSSLETLL
jgi:hypothetical protein